MQKPEGKPTKSSIVRRLPVDERLLPLTVLEGDDCEATEEGACGRGAGVGLGVRDETGGCDVGLLTTWDYDAEGVLALSFLDRHMRPLLRCDRRRQ